MTLNTLSRVSRQHSLILIALISLVAFTSCSSRGGRSDSVSVERFTVGDTLVVRSTPPEVLPPPVYDLEPDLEIGVEEGPEEYVLMQPDDIGVDGDGNIFVSDQRAGEVRVYDRAGTHRLSFGRRGEGPGEFHSEMWGLFDVHPVAGGLITVEDNPQLRIFDRDGTYLRSFDLTFVLAADSRLRTSAYDIHWFPERQQLVVNWFWRRQSGDWVMPRVNTLAVLNEDLEIVHEMPPLEPPTGMYSMDQRAFSLPFTAEYCWGIAGGNRLVWGVGSHYRLDTFDLDTEAWLRIEFALDPEPVTAAELDAWKVNFLERYSGGDEGAWRPLLNQATYPSHKPVYADILGDDQGRIWVQRYSPITGPEGEELTRYDLFSSDGVWQGIVDAPARLNCIVGGSAYWFGYPDYPVIRRARLIPYQ